MKAFTLDLSEEEEMHADDGDEYWRLGSDVALTPDFAIGGAREARDGLDQVGAVYVFDRTDSWDQSDKLVADDGADGDYFGRSVDAVETPGGDVVLVVGADQTNNGLDGAVYVFRHNGSSCIATAAKPVQVRQLDAAQTPAASTELS